MAKYVEGHLRNLASGHGERLTKALEAAAAIMDHLTGWDWNDPKNVFDDAWYLDTTKIRIDAFAACFDAKESKIVLKALHDDFNRLEENANRRDFGEVATDTALIGYHVIAAMRNATSLWI